MERQFEPEDQIGRQKSWEDYKRRMAFRVANAKMVSKSVLHRYLDTPKPLEEWLTRQDPSAIVGDWMTPDDSVLANFLWDCLQVYADTFDVMFDGHEFYDLPDWYKKYTRIEWVRMSELREQVNNRQRTPSWTASEALEMLQQSLAQARKE